AAAVDRLSLVERFDVELVAANNVNARLRLAADKEQHGNATALAGYNAVVFETGIIEFGRDRRLELVLLLKRGLDLLRVEDLITNLVVQRPQVQLARPSAVPDKPKPDHEEHERRGRDDPNGPGQRASATVAALGLQAGQDAVAQSVRHGHVAH